MHVMQNAAAAVEKACVGQQRAGHETQLPATLQGGTSSCYMHLNGQGARVEYAKEQGGKRRNGAAAWSGQTEGAREGQQKVERELK